MQKYSPPSRRASTSADTRMAQSATQAATSPLRAAALRQLRPRYRRRSTYLWENAAWQEVLGQVPLQNRAGHRQPGKKPPAPSAKSERRGEISKRIDPRAKAAQLIATGMGLMVVGKTDPGREVLETIVDAAFAELG